MFIRMSIHTSGCISRRAYYTPPEHDMQKVFVQNVGPHIPDREDHADHVGEESNCEAGNDVKQQVRHGNIIQRAREAVPDVHVDMSVHTPVPMCVSTYV